MSSRVPSSEHLVPIGKPVMKQFDERTKANLDVVLEEACSNLPQGGAHEYRKFVTRKFVANARKGNTSLMGPAAVAHKAVVEQAATNAVT
jgi:hypothetical protein